MARYLHRYRDTHEIRPGYQGYGEIQAGDTVEIQMKHSRRDIQRIHARGGLGCDSSVALIPR